MTFRFLVEDGSGQEQGLFTFSGQPTDAETVTVSDGTNTIVYEFDSNSSVTSPNVSVTIGASASVTADNLAAAITASRLSNNISVTAVSSSSVVTLYNINIVGGFLLTGSSSVTISDFSVPNSLVSVEDADTYLAPNIHASNWVALSTSDKQKLLAFSTIFLNDRVIWEGTKTVPKSYLAWPRTGVVDRDNISVGVNEIPVQLKRAAAEMARFLVDTDRTIERSQDGLKGLIVDVIEIKFDDHYRLPTTPSHMFYLIEGLGILRGTGHGSARVLRT